MMETDLVSVVVNVCLAVCCILLLAKLITWTVSMLQQWMVVRDERRADDAQRRAAEERFRSTDG